MLWIISGKQIKLDDETSEGRFRVMLDLIKQANNYKYFQSESIDLDIFKNHDINIK